MMQSRDLILLEDLIQKKVENSVVEFKENNSDPKQIAKLCSALSNSARIENKNCAYVVWGVNDGTKKIVGTTFDPAHQLVGNTVLELWLAQRLSPSLAISFKQLNHDDGKVIILEIPAATTSPVASDSIQYIRIGSATPKLMDYPDYFRKLIDNIRPYAWEKGAAKQFASEDEILELLDYPSYFKLTKQPLPDNRKGIFENLEADRLIEKDVTGYWNITNLGAITLANDLEGFGPSLSRKGVRFVAYDGNNRAATVTHRQDGRKGYANGFAGLISYINGLLPVNEHIGKVFREETPLYPDIALRELIANAIIHQDMTISGAGPKIELFSDRIEITNPGIPLVSTERMIDLPPRSRNEALASMMRRMKLCEEQGSGLDKVILNVELYQLPPPKFHAEESSMQVILFSPRSFGEMTIDERVRACYQHAVIKYLSNERMKNNTLCVRFGIESKNAAQASGVIRKALEDNLIKVADPEHPRAGYVPSWA